jgi:hypothetical protein
MDMMILAVISVIAFCFCAAFFLRALVKPLPFLNISGFSKAALRIKKFYQVFSWGLMTFTFLFALSAAFYQVYTDF